MTEVMSASVAAPGGFHRSASSTSLSSASLLQRSASTGSLNSLKGSRTQLKTRMVPPSPPPSPKLSASDFSFDVSDHFDSGLCLDDEIYLPIYDYDTSPPDELHVSSLSPPAQDSANSKESSGVSAVETPEVVVTAVDDSEIKLEPSRHVDYLSHEWTEEEIASSWRYMVGKRNMYEYSARLENASWRTWAKSKFNLSTISPKKLNWSKECDVTWLYGPLSRGEEKVSSTTKSTDSSSSNAASYSPPSNNGGSGYPMKPILKKRSMSEVMLAKSLSTSSLLKQATAAIQSQSAEKRRPLPSRAVSDFGTGIRRAPTMGATSDFPTALASGSQSPGTTKHISFNNQVQQCIAVEVDKDVDMDCDGGPVFNIGPDDDESSSDDGVVMMGKRLPASRTSCGRSLGEQKTIAMLPSTTLKAVEDPAPKRSMSFAGGLTSFFLGSTGGSGGGTYSRPIPTPSAVTPEEEMPQLPDYSTLPTYDLSTDEDEDELAELNWGSSAFSQRRDSISLARPRFETSLSTVLVEPPSCDMDFKYEEDEDDEVAAGLFGRAVDAVNTARDIAHVIWNVGWRA